LSSTRKGSAKNNTTAHHIYQHPPQKIYTTNVEGKFMATIQKISATRHISRKWIFTS